MQSDRALPHPLSILQLAAVVLWFGILYALRSGFATGNHSSLLLLSWLLLFAISLASVRMGWLTVYRNQAFFSILQFIALSLTRKLKGPKAARELEIAYAKPGHIRLQGIIELVIGASMAALSFMVILAFAIG
jgi:hypothetical protein